MNEIFQAIDRLGQELEGIDGIEQVLREWPTPNTALKTPSISLSTASATIHGRLPTVVSAMPSDVQEQVNSLFIVGEYELQIQLDIWTEYAPQREEFYGKVSDLFYSQIVDGRGSGLKLALPNYHGAFVQYDLNAYRYLDNPEMAIKGEWRISCDVSASFAKLKQEAVPKIIEAAIMEEDISVE